MLHGLSCMHSTLSCILFLECAEPQAFDEINSESEILWNSEFHVVLGTPSPTAAIIQAEELLRNSRSEIKGYIDVLELSECQPPHKPLETSPPKTEWGPTADLWTQLDATAPNSVYISEVAVLCGQRSEIDDICELLPGSRLYKIRTRGASLSTRELHHPATLERRAYAALTDYLIALLLFFSYRAVLNSPSVVLEIIDRKRVDVHELKLEENVELIPNLFGTNFTNLALGSKAKASFNFPFSTDKYSMSIAVHNPSSVEATLVLATSDREYSLEVEPFRIFRKRKIGNTIPLKAGERVTVSTPEQPETILIDFIDFSLDTDFKIPRSDGDRSVGWEDMLRLIGLWGYSDLKFVILEFLVLLAVMSYFIQCLCMYCFKTTLGCWLAQIKIVTAQNAKTPSVWRMLLRLSGYLVSLLTLGTGLFFPITSPSTRNENLIDRISGTVLVFSGRKP